MNLVYFLKNWKVLNAAEIDYLIKKNYLYNENKSVILDYAIESQLNLQLIFVLTVPNRISIIKLDPVEIFSDTFKINLIIK